MKKIICALLALTLLFGLAGCGGNKNDSKDDPKDEVTESQKPQGSEAPDKDDSSEKPESSANPSEKPSASEKPTTSPKPSEKPATSPKPSDKPVESAKPSEKPTTSPKPSEKPTTSPKPSEKPVESAKPELTISDVLSSIYYGTGDLPTLGTVSITADTFKNYLFIDSIQGAEAMASEALIGSIAHSVVVLKVPDGTDAATTAASVKAAANPRKWICVEAEKVIVRSSGNWVLLVMTDAANADIIAANFDYLMSQK